MKMFVFYSIVVSCLVIHSRQAISAPPVVAAAGSAAGNVQQPQLAIDADGVIHLVFGVGDSVQYVRSADGGKSFSKPVTLATVRVLALGMRRGPRIATWGDSVFISVIGGKQGKGRDGDVLLFRSTDKGQRWGEPIIVNDQADSAREGLHAMAAGAKGRLTCVWLDLRNKSTEVFASTSTDDGESWSKNTVVYHSPNGSVCECCHPSVIYAPDGALHVMWRNSLAGKRDMYHAVSEDGGVTYQPAQKLGNGSWSIDHCPMDGGSIAVLKDGSMTSVWRRDKTVFFLGRSNSKEVELGAGEQPWITATNQGPVVVWLQKRKGTLLLQKKGLPKPVELAQTASDPVIACGGVKSDVVIAAWEDHGGGERRIVCQRIEPAP